MVRCFSPNRFMPVHGKCGFAMRMPPPLRVRSRPRAQPLLAAPVLSKGKSGNWVLDEAPVLDGISVAMGGPAAAMLLARAIRLKAIRWKAAKSVVVTGTTHSAPRHQPATASRPVYLQIAVVAGHETLHPRLHQAGGARGHAQPLYPGVTGADGVPARS
jgi:hypothetical protein